MVAFKRKRVKTGPHSWINITQRQNGTSHRSVSNKAGNTTTNVSRRGVKKTQNNSGWINPSWYGNNPRKKKSFKVKSSAFSWGLLFGTSKSSKTKQKKQRPIKYKHYSEDPVYYAIEDPVERNKLYDLMTSLSLSLKDKFEVGSDDYLLFGAIVDVVALVRENENECQELCQEVLEHLEESLNRQTDPEIISAISVFHETFSKLRYCRRAETPTEEKPVNYWPAIVAVAIICFIVQKCS